LNPEGMARESGLVRWRPADWPAAFLSRFACAPINATWKLPWALVVLKKDEESQVDGNNVHRAGSATDLR
jgi:hypothetical protein